MQVVVLRACGAFLLLAVLPVLALSADWDDCHSALEELRDAADSAADDAERAARAARDLEDCRLDSSVSIDRCRSERSDYEDAANRAKSEARDVVSALANVRASCRLSGGAARLARGSSLCTQLNVAVDKDPRAGVAGASGVLQFCAERFLMLDCLQCLGYVRSKPAAR